LYELASRILVFPSAISEPEKLIDLVLEAPWTKNKNTSPHPIYGHTRFQTTLHIKNGTSYANKILAELDQVFLETKEFLNFKPSAPLKIFDFEITKYTVGGKISDHTDDDIVEDEGTYTGIIYLNDSYAGGELGFTNTSLKIKPRAGDIIVFPAFYSHYADEVLSGEKYLSIFKTYPEEDD